MASAKDPTVGRCCGNGGSSQAWEFAHCKHIFKRGCACCVRRLIEWFSLFPFPHVCPLNSLSIYIYTYIYLCIYMYIHMHIYTCFHVLYGFLLHSTIMLYDIWRRLEQKQLRPYRLVGLSAGSTHFRCVLPPLSNSGFSVQVLGYEAVIDGH